MTAIPLIPLLENGERRIVPALFEMGQLSITPAAEEVADEHGIDLFDLLIRHLSGDWGDQYDDGKQLNDAAIENGYRILSMYGNPDGDERIWIHTLGTTNGRRLATCIMTPSDY